MSWGPYWFYYNCTNCGGKFRWCLDELTNPDFGHCPFCGEEMPMAFESKDLTPEQAGTAADYTIAE